MASRRNIGLLIGIGVAGLAGYGITRLLGAKKKGKPPEQAMSSPASEPDRPIEMVVCSGCGKNIKEYEFFCPHCGKSREKSN